MSLKRPRCVWEDRGWVLDSLDGYGCDWIDVKVSEWVWMSLERYATAINTPGPKKVSDRSEYV